MRAGTTRILLLAGALILAVLLFIAPKNAEKPAAEAAPQGLSNPGAGIETYLRMAAKVLEPGLKTTADRLENTGKHDSLIDFWSQKRRPDLSAHYAEQKAKKAASAELWFEAGSRYYYSVQFIQDRTEIPLLYNSAIRCLNEGLKLKPDDTDARVMLASAIIDGTGEPMQGITMLREIEKSDSNNVKVQMAFAMFSVKSGQMDKAVGRFKKVLRADSNFIEAYLHLADAYEQMNETDLTIQMLEQYARRTNDITSRMEVERYIKQLKGTN